MLVDRCRSVFGGTFSLIVVQRGSCRDVSGGVGYSGAHRADGVPAARSAHLLRGLSAPGPRDQGPADRDDRAEWTRDSRLVSEPPLQGQEEVRSSRGQDGGQQSSIRRLIVAN